MNTNSNKKRHVRKILAVLFLLLSLTSSGAKNTSASTLTSTLAVESSIDPERQHMLDIAYLYAHHRWTATLTNIIHPSQYNFNCDGLCEADNTTQRQIWWYPANSWTEITRAMMMPPDSPLVDTPNWVATGDYLFSLDPATLTDLNNGGQPTTLIRNAFQTNGITLSATARIEVERIGGMMEEGHISGKWVIDDAGTRYQIRQRQQIYVYDGGENEGVPYSWGMSSGLIATQRDLAVPLNPPMRAVYMPISRATWETIPFDEMIDNRYFAGNQNHDTDKGNTRAAGVDCVGLINNVWQMGARYHMSDLRDKYSVPISFRDLEPGDILLNYDSHVMLFEKFENYDPASGEDPIPGQTQFSVYEASGDVWKVRHYTYTYDGNETDSTKPNDIFIKYPGNGQRLSGSYTPAAYKKNIPIDVVLVIDKSGSMENTIGQVKYAAQSFVDMMRVGDKISIVSFNTAAVENYHLTQITTDDATSNGIPDVKEAAYAAINSIQPSGGTSINEGLYGGYQELSNFGTSDGTSTGDPDRIRVIVLLSDGYGTPPSAVTHTNIEDANIIVHTLGIGTSVGADLLRDIASQHYGEYQWIRRSDEVRWALNTIREKIYGGSTAVASEPLATLLAGGTANKNVLVDSAMGSMTVTFFPVNGNVALALTQPDGNALDLNSPSVTHISGTNYETYTILAPQIGAWNMSTSSASGGSYSLSVSTMDAMTFSVNPDKDNYLAGMPIKLTASINDSTSGSLLAPPDYVHGAVLHVAVENPSLAQYTFDLYDDGAHGDGDADDGIYANSFNGTALEGSYNFTVQASGNNNRDGQPFMREKALSVVVIPPPVVSSIVRSSSNPSSAETVDFKVTFTRNVTGVDESDFALTTTGVSGAAVSSVAGSGSVYTVTVNTGSNAGTIHLNVLDDDTIVDEYDFALGSGYTNGPTYTMDKTGSTVFSIVRSSANSSTTYYHANFTVTFSESVVGVDPTDFSLTTNGISDATVSSVSGSGTVYTVTAYTGNGDGTLRLDLVDNDTIKDGSGNFLTGAGTPDGSFVSGEAYDVDKTTSIGAVTKLEDTNDGVCDADCSLREAVASAPADSSVTFDAALSGGTIRLASTLVLSRNVAIDGSALETPITISGDTDGNGSGNVQALKVNSGTTVTLNGLIISMGYAVGSGGGGIYNSGILDIVNVTISSNSAYSSYYSYGGGIYNNGTLAVTGSTFTGNKALSGLGGAIYNSYGTISVKNSTFSGNSAYTGGAVYSYSGSTNITNSTFSNNSATNLGGTIYNVGTLTLIHDTISGGSASAGGGVVNASYRTMNFSNTIIANSSGGDCVNNGSLGTNIQNLVEDGSCSASVSGDPALDVLADNNWSTQTMALLPGSPALNMGDKTTCVNSPVNNFDQRGVTRLLGGQCDLGAYEVAVDPASVPMVETFAAASFSASMNVAITDFTASDDTGVTGYLVTESSLPPALGDAGWSGSAPASYSVSTDGVHTLYPWVKDTDGHVSSAYAQPVSVTVQLPTATPTMTGTPTQTPTPTPTATPYPNALMDEFSDTTLATYWEWYLLKAGPTYSLSAAPGAFRFSLPAYETFEHWEAVDTAPQLRLKNFGPGDWAIETRLENVDASADAGYWAALTVGFPGSDQIWFGMVDDGYLKSYRLSEGEYFAVDVEMPIALRLEKVGESYTFKYKSDTDLLWTAMPAINYAGTPSFVGLIGRGFNTGSAEMHMDWSYFRVENWSAATPTPVVSTATSTPTETATPTVTVTGETPTPSVTPITTPTSGTVLDEFTGTLLGSDWEWYLPAAGPSYSLIAEPNHLQLIVPPGYDHWSDLDSSPQIRRSDMGGGDWAIETYLALDDSNAGDAWQVNLVAGFDRYDQQWLSIDSDNTLHVTHVGGDDTAFVDSISLPIYLRMERTGVNYTFKYKENVSDPWTTLDVQIVNDPVAYVGLQFRTFAGSSGDAVFNIDYFQMERSSSPDPGPTKEIALDDYDNQTLNADWTWYTPKPGPTYSLTDIPGSFRMSLPAYNSFEHWDIVDDAPQLRRTDLGTGDWAIETQLENIAATNAGYWAALEVGFDQTDQIWFGMVDDGNLKVYRLSEGEYAVIPESLPLILRIEKHGETYIFKYRHNPAEAWTSLAPKNYTGTPTYVGAIGRGFDTGTADMLLDWSYFRLEKWTPTTQPPPQSGSFGMSGAEGRLGNSKAEPKVQKTPTPSSIPSPTTTLTSTPEFAPLQPVSTPAFPPISP